MQTTTIGAFEARRNFGKLLNDVGYRRSSIVVEKNGEKLAAIVPIEVLESWKQNRKELFDTIRQMQQEANLSPEEADKLAAEAVRVTHSQQER
jgi:prevent-host-death family protein